MLVNQPLRRLLQKEKKLCITAQQEHKTLLKAQSHKELLLALSCWHDVVLSKRRNL